MELEQAIRISKILCQADEGRLPMILSVLEKAGVNIDGLEELEEWKALTCQGYLIDVDEFVDGLKSVFTGDEKSESYGFDQYPVQRRGYFVVRPAKYRGHPLHAEGQCATVPGVRPVHNISG